MLWSLKILALTFVLSGCGPEVTSMRTSPSQREAADDVQDAAKPYVSSRQFGILDPFYDYTPNDQVDALALAGRFPIHTDQISEVAYLNSGEDFYAARIALLNAATKSVRIQSLIFSADESGYQLSQKIIETADRGIDVRIIIDPLVNFDLKSQRLYLYLKRNGITIEGYEFLYLNLIAEVGSEKDLGVMLDKNNMRYHEKLFIIDAEDEEKARAIIGGSNIGNAYFRAETADSDRMWSDRDVMLRGPIVRDLARSFEMNFQEFQASRLKLGNTDLLWAAINAIFKRPSTIKLKLNERTLGTLRDFEKRSLDLDWQPVDIRFVQSRPRFNEDFIYPAIIDSINSAKEEVFINNSYMVLEDEIIAALIAAAKRGVNVKLLTNSTETIDLPFLMQAGRAVYKDLLVVNNSLPNGATIEIYEWQGDKILGNNEGLNHSKYLVIDRKLTSVGSYNLDPRSHFLNSESVVFFESEESAAKYHDHFLEEISPAFSKSISYQESLSFVDPQNIKGQLDNFIAGILKPLL